MSREESYEEAEFKLKKTVAALTAVWNAPEGCFIHDMFSDIPSNPWMGDVVTRLISGGYLEVVGSESGSSNGLPKVKKTSKLQKPDKADKDHFLNRLIWGSQDVELPEEEPNQDQGQAREFTKFVNMVEEIKNDVSEIKERLNRITLFESIVGELAQNPQWSNIVGPWIQSRLQNAPKS